MKKISGSGKGTIGAGVLISLMLLFILLSQASSASLTFQGRACNVNSICDVIRNCSTSGCTSSYENCQSCGATSRVCPNGVATTLNACVDSGTPHCIPGVPVCSNQSGITDPHVILTFTVFTKKNLVINITPENQTALAGRTLNYKVGVENKNPRQLTFQISSQIPQNWQINIPATTSIAANGNVEIPFRVTSNETASDASYPIIVGMFNSELNLFGAATAQYIVASRGPPSVSANPRSQAGYPGQPLFYNISVTNNNPADFDASSVTLRANAPDGFNAVFTPNSINLQPQATGYVRLDVTSPSNASEATYGLTINATANGLTAVEFIEYMIDFCGDSVCQQGEEGICLRDCPSDSNFFCNGRCEREVDDGLEFAATVNVPYNRFIVCSRNASLSTCVQAAGRAAAGGFPGINNTNVTANCGIGKPCLCSSSQPNCKTLCVDANGVYYLAASTGNSSTRGLVNWSYACPFVDLPDIIAMREDFASARNEYEEAQSALRESFNTPNTTLQRKSEILPCIDALSGIISGTRDYVTYLDAVIAWPGRINTTAARLRAEGLRASIESTYNTYCTQATGLLQIEGISVPQAEKGETVRMVATVSNIGSTPYYGYVQCDITGAAGERTSANSSCAQISGATGFGFDVNATSAGRWTTRCRVLGSLISNCTLASIHSEASVQFNVSTRETFVIDMSGSCSGTNASGLTCSVRGSQPGCVGCRALNIQSAPAGADECTLVSDNGTSRFSCPMSSYGNHTLFGYVLDNERCKPVAPAEKNISVRCPGCGDGIVERGEQCETPYTNNNQRCTQAQSTCQERLFGIRDAAGFCTAECSCSPDQYEFSCTRGQCGAECLDGETRTVTVNKTTGSCLCTQQCSGGCTWNPCDCEPESGGGAVCGNGRCESGETTQNCATDCETGGGAVCGNGRCESGETTQNCVTDCGTGGGGGAFTDPPSVQISHSPQTPTSGTVILTASAVNSTSIEIYVDGFIVRTCQSSPCSLTATYEPGIHSYFGRASNPIGVDTDPDQGTKTFTVPARGTPNQTIPNQTTTTNNSITLTISHNPQNPTTQDTVTITAAASTNADRVEIYVDGVISRICSDFLCTLDRTYSAGAHTYFAIAYDGSASVANPLTGTRSFTVSSGTPNQTIPNQTTTTNNSITLTISHNPQNPTTQDTVTITAAASTNANRIDIYVDGFLSKSCNEFVCSLASRYPAGGHTYFAIASDGSASVANPLTGTRSFIVTQSAASGNGTGETNGTTGGLETTNIILDVSHNPQSITTQDTVTLTAIAHGPRSFREINIFADNSLKKTCTNTPSSQPCTFRSTFPEGNHDYFAFATDILNSSSRDPQTGLKSFSVSAPAPTGPTPPPGGPVIGSGPTPPTAGGSSPGRCFAKIIDRNCTYNAATRRYDLRISAIWDNGTHAHWEIDGTPGAKMYVKNFAHVEPLSAPGMKSVKVPVHNVNDSLLCMDSTEVYCGPGSSSGKDLDVTIDVRDVVKTGLVDVRVIVAPYVDINALRLQNYIESPLNVSSVRIEGNTSLSSISGPVRVAEDKSYTLYTASTNLAAGRNISVLYKIRIDNPGEYKLMAVANYSAMLRVSKTVKATNCPQTFQVLAVSPSDASLCLPYTTPCDVPPGWMIVERCPDEAPVQESSILPLIILIIIVVIIAALLYKKRDALREKLGSIRNRRRAQKEELPRFEEE